MNRAGGIVLNRYVFEALGNPEAAYLLYDPQTDSIGVKPASRQVPNAFVIRVSTNCGHRIIFGKPFTKKYNIIIDFTVRFRTPEIEDGILVLNLRDTVSVVRGYGGPRKADVTGKTQQT